MKLSGVLVAVLAVAVVSSVLTVAVVTTERKREEEKARAADERMKRVMLHVLSQRSASRRSSPALNFHFNSRPVARPSVRPVPPQRPLVVVVEPPASQTQIINNVEVYRGYRLRTPRYSGSAPSYLPPNYKSPAAKYWEAYLRNQERPR